MAIGFSKLVHFTERMTKAAKDPEMTEALSWFGMNPTRIMEVEDALQTCKKAREEGAALLAARKSINKQKRAALDRALKASSSLGFCIRKLFPNSPYRSMLNMQTRYAADQAPEPKDASEERPITPAGKKPGTRNRSEAAYKLLLPQTFNNLQNLPEENRNRLTQFGWDEQRIAHGKELVQAYLKACKDSEQADVAYKQHMKQTKERVDELLKTYRVFSKQIRRNADRYPHLNRHLLQITQPLSTPSRKTAKNHESNGLEETKQSESAKINKKEAKMKKKRQTHPSSSPPAQAQTPPKLPPPGQIYDAIAEDEALAIQDSMDHLRNMETLSTTALGVALEQMESDGQDQSYETVIKEAKSMIEKTRDETKTQD